MKLEEKIKELLKENGDSEVIVITVKGEDEVGCAVIGDECKLASALKYAVDNNTPLKDVFNHAAKHALHDLVENQAFSNLIKKGAKIHES